MHQGTRSVSGKAGTKSLLTLIALCWFAAAGRLSATVYLGWEIETNDTPADATPLFGADVKITGNIYPNADVDYYAFTARVGDRVYAAVMTAFSASASSDSQLRIVAPDGVTVLEFDEDDGVFGAQSSSIAGVAIPANGTYYARVNHYSATGQLRPYELWLRVQSAAPVPETEPNDTLPGQALPASGWVSGTTSSTADMDLFRLDLNAGDTVFLSLDLDPERDTGTWNGQVGLGLFNTFFLVANDGNALSTNSEAFFMTAKDAGAYSVMVNAAGGAATSGTYQLSVSVLPAAAQVWTTYTSADVPKTLADTNTTTSTLLIPHNRQIGSLKIRINLTHINMPDLDASLTAPGGNTVGLFTDIGTASQTNLDLVLDDAAGVPLSAFTVLSGMISQPESADRLGWFNGQQAQGTWTLTIRDDAAASTGTLLGWSLVVCDDAPPPAGAPLTLFSSDFESGDGGFTHAGTQDEWECGAPAFAPITNSHSGTQCWKTDLDNTYNASASADLFSPGIDLTTLVQAQPIMLTWAMKHQLESATYDHAFLEVQEVGGGAARRVWEWTGASQVDSQGTPSAVVAEAAGWGLHRVAISDFAGKIVRLRIHLDSDSTVQYTGLAIDDVAVTAYPAFFRDNADFVMNWLGVPGRAYRVKRTADMLTGAWEDFLPPAAFTAPDTSVFTFTNSSPPGPLRFYRMMPDL